MGKLYMYRVFKNTAASEGRLATKDDIDDWYQEQIECDNDYAALQAIYDDLFPYNDDADNFSTEQDYIEFFKSQDLRDGLPFLLCIFQGRRPLYNANVSLTEYLGLRVGKVYKYRIFNNTACAERRPATEEDLEDYYDDEIECDNDFEALQTIYEEIFPYKDDSDEFETAQDFVEFFEEQDLGDGSSFPIYIRQGNRTLYDLGMTIGEIIGLVDYDEDEEEYDDEYED